MQKGATLRLKGVTKIENLSPDCQAISHIPDYCRYFDSGKTLARGGVRPVPADGFPMSSTWVRRPWSSNPGQRRLRAWKKDFSKAERGKKPESDRRTFLAEHHVPSV